MSRLASEYHDAIAHLETVIAEFGGAYKDWYVGIARNGQDRLAAHNVQNEPWATYRTTHEQIARDVEAFFIDQRGTQGGKSGGDSRTRTVYAFRISATTTE